MQNWRKLAAFVGLLIVFLTLGTPCVCGDGVIQKPQALTTSISAEHTDNGDAGCVDEDCFCCATITPSSTFVLTQSVHSTALQHAPEQDSPVAPAQSFYRPPKA